MSVLRNVSELLYNSGRCTRIFSTINQARKVDTNKFLNEQKLKSSIESVTGRMWGSLVLERYPVIMPELPEWEREYEEWSFARQNEKRKILPQIFTSTQYNEENSAEVDWEPAPRITPDDVAKNTKSLNRALDKKLYLVVKSAGVEEWQFPHALHAPGQTMRQVVDCVVEEKMPVPDDVFVIGNAPSGHFTIPENVSVGDARATDTLFFYRANYLEESFSLPPASPWKDYAWVTNTELWTEYFTGDQAELMKSMLKAPPIMQ